eukprot:5715075-Alexandrium_andersonii.AAC.1
MQWEGAQQPVVVQDSWRCPMSSHAVQPFRWTGITIFVLAGPHAVQSDIRESALVTPASCGGGVGVGAGSHESSEDGKLSDGRMSPMALLALAGLALLRDPAPQAGPAGAGGSPGSGALQAPGAHQGAGAVPAPSLAASA